jgi:hypothetical protein
MSIRVIVAVASTAVAFTLCACNPFASEPADSQENAALLESLQSAGVGCNSVLHAQSLNDENTAWRIACDENRVYLASIDAGGQLCASPVAYLEAPVTNGRSIPPSLPPQPLNPSQSLEETSRCAPYAGG